MHSFLFIHGVFKVLAREDIKHLEEVATVVSVSCLHVIPDRLHGVEIGALWGPEHLLQNVSSVKIVLGSLSLGWRLFL